MFHVKHRFSLDPYLSFLHSRKIELDSSQIRQLSTYYNLLLQWSKRQNLFAAGDRPFLLERHFLPCLCFYEFVRHRNPDSIADVGSGAGFPGVVLQIMMPELMVQFIDSSRKKCLFLQEVSETVRFESRIINSRVEDLLISDRLSVDMVVARFVSDIKILWNWTAPMIKPSGFLLVQKGEQFDESLSGMRAIQTYTPDISWKMTVPALESKYFIEVEKENV
jgi:16S rRNA (guanine527-N7)-methyltransferase